MHCVCFQTKSSKTVHSFMRDRRINAYGVRLKSHLNSLVKLTPQKFPFFSKLCDNFVTVLKIALENVLSKIERRVLVPN